MNGLLTDKTAVIYGAGGGLGRTVAHTFAREGALVHLVGRTQGALDAVADTIAADGGRGQVAVVDALDERAVVDHLRAAVDRTGRVDVSFNLISRSDVQGTPLLDLDVEDFVHPIALGARANFITARAAARHMVSQRSGVILTLTSGSGETTTPHWHHFHMGGTGPADAATETFMRYLAAEVGPAGVRVLGLWTAGVSETFHLDEDTDVTRQASEPGRIETGLAALSMLGRVPRVQQVADTAAFLASDRAAAITGSIVNVTSGLSVR